MGNPFELVKNGGLTCQPTWSSIANFYPVSQYWEALARSAGLLYMGMVLAIKVVHTPLPSYFHFDRLAVCLWFIYIYP